MNQIRHHTFDFFPLISSNYMADRGWGARRVLPILENLVKCFNKYIRIIYNWHTLCLNANTAVKVVLKNSLLAFFSFRKNIFLVYSTHLLSKPLFIL
jgi:hypothetical protein